MKQRKNVAHSEKMISYPSRIEESIVKKINKIRLRKKISWPALTASLLKEFIEKNS